jgi:argininosuccinate lyase
MAGKATRATGRKTTVGTIGREALDYTAGRDRVLDLALVEADCIGSMAHAVMLSELPVRPPVLRKSELRPLRGALLGLMREAREGRFEITAEDQDVHLAVERRLTAALGDAGRRIHTARSRNDQVALDLRLHARTELLAAIREAGGLAKALSSLARRNRAVPMVGRTHQQRAMPSSVGLWASAFAEELLDAIALLVGAYELNDQCPLGAAAGYGVPIPIDRRRTSALLGFSRPAPNTLYAIHSRGRLESIALSALGQGMLTLSRLAQDLILYSLPEFGYFTLPAEYCTGSSIMPQKRNPDVLELVRARAARVLSDAAFVAEVLRAAPSGYNRDVQETKEPFLAGLATTRASLAVLTGLIRGIAVDRARLTEAFSPDVFAADEALKRVLGGMPFRDAYHEVKARLEDLRGEDPAISIRARNHLGAPGGLDFNDLDRRIGQKVKWAAAARRKHDRAVSALLGVRYPDLGGA